MRNPVLTAPCAPMLAAGAPPAVEATPCSSLGNVAPDLAGRFTASGHFWDRACLAFLSVSGVFAFATLAFPRLIVVLPSVVVLSLAIYAMAAADRAFDRASAARWAANSQT